MAEKILFRHGPAFVLMVLVVGVFSASAATDLREISNGSVVPDENYTDQPYIVVTKDGNWLCTLTTGPGDESFKGQHITATISTDKGKTWSEPIGIEPSCDIESSWVVPLVVPSGRVYAFYNYNGDDVRNMPDGSSVSVSTLLGWYCYKYSDDNGRTWSKRRYRLPVRMTACDHTNDWNGKVQLFWGIDKPKVSNGRGFFAFTKLGRYMLEEGEGWLFSSDNILTEPDPAKLHWTMLPDGEHGIRSPEFGSVQEEHNIVPLGGDNLYCVYRTTTGCPCHTYSDDGGRTWSKPEHMTYTPGGRKIKTPRACPKLWRTADGRFLFWYHNHGGRDFERRNPAWISGGVLKDGRIHWSQPEILLYDISDPKVRMSYPDLIEQDGRYWVTETNKLVARVHEIDKTLLEGLWSQGEIKKIARDGLVLEWQPGGDEKPVLPREIDMARTGGIAIDCWVEAERLDAAKTLLAGRAGNGGVSLTALPNGAVRLKLDDGESTAVWESDPESLQAGKLHHVVAIADAGPRIITFVVDGVLCDGGRFRSHGWGRWQGALATVLDAGELTVDPAVKSLRVYDRYLRTSEAIGNFHGGQP